MTSGGADGAYPGTQEVSLAALGVQETPVPLATVVREALAQVERAHQVRWAIQTEATVAPDVAPRLARAVAVLTDAATAKSGALAALVSVRNENGKLIVTVSDRARGAPPGQLALGDNPGAILALVKRLGATLTASPGRSGDGTDTVLSMPIGRSFG
jgi:hypothetical protein